MSSRIKAILWVVILSGIIGVVIGHMITWNNNGTHVEMFLWPGTGKGYLTVLYNLALMLVTGVMLGMLMNIVGSMIGRDHNTQAKWSNSKQTPDKD